jgi:hypothetical protein
MARFRDASPYAVGDVYCATRAENVRDANANRRQQKELRP